MKKILAKRYYSSARDPGGVPSAKKGGSKGTPKRTHWFVGNEARRAAYFAAKAAGKTPPPLTRTWREGDPVIVFGGKDANGAAAIFVRGAHRYRRTPTGTVRA